MVQVSSDPETLQAWAVDALASGLFREDGIAQHVFKGEGAVHKMAYIPGVAWVMNCTWRGWSKRIHAFTRPDQRCQGICEQLCRAIDPEHFNPIYDRLARKTTAEYGGD